MDARRDVLTEWLALGREVLSLYYPTAPHAVLVVPLGDDAPAAQFVVIRAGASPSPAPAPVRPPAA